MSSDIGRTPPHSRDAEIAVLGGMLCSPNAAAVALDILAPGDFYIPAHREIFAAMAELWKRSQPIDMITVSDYLKECGKLEVIGGAAYLSEIYDSVGTGANIEHYAQIVKDKALKRELISAAEQIIGTVHKRSEQEAKDLIEHAEQLVFQIGERGLYTQVRDFNELLDEIYSDIRERIERGKGLDLIPTGIANIDRGIVGLGRGNLILLSARPSMGKTTLALMIAEKVARSTGKPVLYFSLEDSRKYLILRMIAYTAELDTQRLAQGQLSVEERARMGVAIMQLKGKVPLLLDDTGGLTMAQIRSRARRMKAERDICMVVIDYLQLISMPPMDGRRYQSREQEISEISRSLKNLARELDIPIFACAQLNREPERRSDKRPNLSDLRESGALEQDADLILMLYRPEYYFKEAEEVRNYAELIVAKNRHGPIMSIPLKFDSTCTKFDNWEGAIPDVRAVVKRLSAPSDKGRK